MKLHANLLLYQFGFQIKIPYSAVYPSGRSDNVWFCNKPFPSCCYFQNESWCKTFLMEMSFICKTMNVQEKLNSIRKVVHQRLVKATLTGNYVGKFVV